MSNKQYLPIVVAIIAVLVVAAAVVCVTHKDNNNSGGDNETYYFYFSTSDSTVGGWHSATGKDAADAFANAMKADNIEYELNDMGYLSKVGDLVGFWYSAMYLYGNTSKSAAEGSIQYPVTSYGSYYASNGWVTINGYDDSSRAGDKLWEMNGNVFFFSMYGAKSEHADPTTDTNWMTTGPFKTTISFKNSGETYNFYISCGSITGWYSATGKDSADAFANAMKAAGLDYEINQYGYLSKIGDYDGLWYSAMYLYGNTSSLAAQASVKYPIKDGETYYASNGWMNIFGYDDKSRTGDKLWEMNGNVFFFSLYDSAPPYDHADPTTDTRWTISGPFGDSEFYYFYISSDQFTGGWHTGVGVDAADAFANAMKADGIIYEIGDGGYLSRIGNESGYWYSAMYTYSNTSKTAAENSILYPIYDKYDSYCASNGWKTICGYDDSSRTGDKLWEMNGNVFFFSLYDPQNYSHTIPATDTKWMGTGPFESTTTLKGSNEEYYFYIDCEKITGWYSATGVDAADAFANAMKSAGLEYTFGPSGYLIKIGDYEGMWFSAMYNYSNTSKLAAEASVKVLVEDSYGFCSSNGWTKINGYDDSSRAGDKLWEMNGNVFFFSLYNESWKPSSDPTTTLASWSTTGPFA